MTENNTLQTERSYGLIRLMAMSIGATLASGVFSLSGDFAASGAHTLAVLIGWTIAGIGMFCLCMCFHRLSVIKPELTSGLYAYSRHGFGEFIGFNVAWGYWLGCILATISFATLLFAAIGYFMPVFGAGNNLISIICVSAIIWLFVALVLRGVNQAASLNVIIVSAKIMPILLLIFAIIFAGKFDMAIFMENFRGVEGGLPLMDQIKATTYTTVWVFVGIEAAVVVSGRAKTTVTAGRATALSFVCLLALYVLISVLSMGVLSTEELAALGNPPMAGVLEAVVGTWGAVLVNIAVIISLGGALFTYTLFTADCAYQPATQQCFPKLFTRLNKHNAPHVALIITNAIVQLFLIIVYFNESTYQICYTLSTSVIMMPYFLSALYCLKVTCKDPGLKAMSAGGRLGVWVIVIVGTIYGAWLLYASGLTYILISALLYGPGIFLFAYTRKEQGKKFFDTRVDAIACVVLALAFILSIVLIINGTLQPF
ncbi:MAG: basic amino acid/polyamine antiporter [Bacillota bacterium]|nr:basic amino acid/polyamine antiporter [Bacillota bacterium]